MQINKNTKSVTHNTTARTGTIQYIAIHYVGATGDAKNNVDYYSQLTVTNASADFFVGHNGDIWQYNPDPKSRYCWAVGGGRQSNYGGSFYGKAKNNNSVSIEMCVKTKSGKTTGVPANSADWYITNETLNATVELTKYLMNLYNVPVDHVIRHFDVTGKLCPGVVGWNYPSGSESAWEDFKARIAYDTKNEEDEDMSIEKFTELMHEYRATLQDNDSNEYSKEAREWATEAGLIQGNSTGEFNGMWEDFMTREQFVTVLYRFAKSIGKA